jgi:CubicO group peptidase (beta-lactamase class C family)
LNWAPVADAFKEAVDQGVFPGAVVLAARAGRVFFEEAFGFRSLLPERQRMHVEDVFDLASLTKPLATTTALMLLVQERKLRLDDPVKAFLPELRAGKNAGMTVRQLLAHCSGLPAWRPYYQDILEIDRREKRGFLGSRQAKKYVYDRVHAEELASAPGTNGVYSDIGFILLGEIVEAVTHLSLDQCCQQKIFAPLRLAKTFFVDLGARTKSPGRLTFVPTQNCLWRGRILCGEVDDDNAYAMGGVAGHAGLFSCIDEVHRLLVCLRKCYLGSDRWLDPLVLREFLSRNGAVEGWSYALGWDTPAAQTSSSGRHFSRTAVGHLGFTGTSIWWDLERDCHIVLLSNRVHPTRENDNIRAFRPYIHDLIMEKLFQ